MASPMRHCKVTGDSRGLTGTEVSFLPSTDTFTMVEFDFKTLEHRLRELAFLNSGVRILLADRRHADPVDLELFYEGGLTAYVQAISTARRRNWSTSRSIFAANAMTRRWKSPCGGMTATTRTFSASPTIFRSAMAARTLPVSVAR